MPVHLCMQQQSLLLRLIKQYFSISGECVVYVCICMYVWICIIYVCICASGVAAEGGKGA